MLDMGIHKKKKRNEKKGSRSTTACRENEAQDEGKGTGLYVFPYPFEKRLKDFTTFLFVKSFRRERIYILLLYVCVSFKSLHLPSHFSIEIHKV